MKKYKGLKLTLIILVIILLSMVSFGGIFIQNKNMVQNILPEYLLARDLKGYRRLELQVSDEVLETIRYDAEGNVIPEDNTETEVAKTEEKKVNDAEVLNIQNYQEAKKIIENRLKAMAVSNYVIRQNQENGNILLELPENNNTDRVVNQLSYQGKFEITDKDTDEVLMNNQDLKTVKAGYGTTATGATTVFINIEFNQEGTEKFKNITNTYIQTTVEKEAESEEQEESEEQAEVEETEESNQEETITKEVAIKLDGSTLLTTYFDEEISNGVLQLSVGSSSSSTTQEDLQEYLQEANNMAAVLDAGKLPIVYEIEQNKFVYSDITADYLKIAISVGIIIATIGMIYLIIKYKTKGILASISLVGYMAILLIALRYFNVEISLGGMVGIVLSAIISYFITIGILKQKEIIPVIKQALLMLIPTLIVAIVFVFANITIGISLFWGVAIALLYHLSITNLMLRD